MSRAARPDRKPDDLHNDVSSAPWATPLVRDPRPFLPSRDQYALSGTLASIQDEKQIVAIGLMAADHDARSLAGALLAHVGSDAAPLEGDLDPPACWSTLQRDSSVGFCRSCGSRVVGRTPRFRHRDPRDGRVPRTRHLRSPSDTAPSPYPST